jgi:DNA-binding transcriptional LysR family regulator
MLERTFEEKFNLSGTLRITSVTHLAHRILIPVLKEFHGLYPEVQVEMDVSDTFQNLIESKFDLAFRIDEPEDSEMVYSWLFANELVICTAPGYLDRNPHPLKSPKDLAKHSVLIYESVKSACFRKSGKPLREFIQQQKFLSESGPFLVDLARQGLGVLVRSRWDIQSDLDEGTLIEVLPNHPLESWGNAYAVIPSRRYLAPRVRALLELVKSAVKK